MAETAVIAAIAAKTGASAATVVAVGAAATAAVASIAISSVQAKKAEADSRKDSARAPRDITVRSAIEPARIIYGEARTSGPVVYTNTASTPGTTDNSTLWTVISLCNHEVEDITDVWLDGDKILASQIVGGNVTSGKYGPIGSNYITNIYKRYGTSTQTHVTQLASAFTDWTDAYDGRGVAYIVTGFELGTATGEGVWAQGAPQNIRAVVKGKKVYDPRKDSTNGGSGTHRLADPTTWEWSDNPALCVADYLFDSRLGMGAEGITYDEIDWAMVTTAANVCDATVTSPAGNQKRFTCNGALSTGETYAENIKQLLSSMAGSLTWSGGKFRIRALAYEAPTYTFTGDDVIGDVQIQPETSRAQRFNLVRGTFIDPASDYVATEFIPVENTTFRDDRDGGQTLNKQIKLPFTNNEYMAQRIAYKQLNVADQQLRCVVPMNYKAMKVAVGDRIQLSIEELSWSNKPFLVEGWVFSPNGGYELTLQEESSSAYADPALGDYSTRTWAGDVVFPDPDVPAPSGLAATNEQEAVLLTWDAPSRPSAYDEVVVYASSSSAWSGASEIGRTRGTTFRHEIDIVPATYPTSATYYYWVRAVDIQGEESIRNPNSDTSSVQGIAQKITTTSLNDDANFASTANWPDITGTGKPEDNATYNTGALADKDTVGEADIDDGAVTINKFGTGLEPVQVVASLPGTATAGQMAFLTTDNKLYRYNGTAWTAAVPFGDVTGAGALAALDTITLTYVTDAGDVAALDSINETYIDDNSITTAKINANAVTAAKIQANTITAAQIAANTITANQIASNTITANQIAANTITSNEIAANTITAGQIAAGTITASEIGAGAIVTSKLAVTGRGSALNSDPNCQDSSAWEKFSGNNATFTTITDGEVGNNVMRSAAGTTWYNGSEALALDPAKTYRMTALVRKNATANGTLYVGVAAFTQDGTNIGGDGTQWSYGAASGISGSTSWTRYTMEFGAGTSYTFPSNAVTFKPIVLMNYSGSTGYFEAQDVRIEEKVGADLIVDGSISTNHLSADSITGAVFDASSYLRAGSGDNSAVMSGRSIDEYAFWAGKGFETDGGPSGADAPFRVTRDGKVIMTNFALYSEAGTKLFDSQDGLLALPQTAVAQASGSLVPQVSEELTSGTDTFTVTLSSTQTITANFAYPVGALFYSGTSLTDAQNNVSSAFAVTLEYSTDSGSTWNTFGSTQNFSKVTSGTPTSSQYLVVANSFTVSIIYGATPTTVYVASLQSNRGAIDEGMTLVGSTSQSLAAGTYLIRMAFSATGGSGSGAPSTTKTREVRLSTSGAGFTVSDGTVSDGVGTSATTGWVLQNFVEKTESDNVTINGTLTLGGDLVVNGTTTTINSTTLEVADKNIVLADGAANAAAADGAGITIDGASASFSYDSTDDAWVSNKILNTQRDVRSAGQVRAAGWWNEAAATDYKAMAYEIGTSGGIPYAIAYDRVNSVYGNMRFEANSFRFLRGDVTVDNALTASGTISAPALRASSSSPTVVINDSNATNDTDTSAYISFQTNGTERGWLGFGSSGNDYFRLSRSSGDIQLHPSGGNVDITTGGLEVGGVSVIDSSRGITGTVMSINSAGHAYLNINGASGYESGIIWKTASTNKWETYIPPSSEDLNFYSYTKPGQVFRLYSGGGAGLTGNLSVTGKLQVTHSSSGLLFEDIGGNATLWLDGSDGDFAGADYFGIRAVGTDRLSFLYASGEKAYINTSGDFYTATDLIVGSRLVGGIGARTTGGTTDWNHSSNARSGSGYTLLLGNATNGPGASGYWHPFSFEYNNKDGTGNMTQFAIPYSSNDGSIYWRTRYSNSWTGWTKLWSDVNDGSGSGLDADKLDSYHQTDFVRLASSSSVSTNGNFAIGQASSRNFIQSHNSQPLDINPIGNDVFFGSTSRSNTTVNIIAADDGMAQLRLYGSSQGTGRVYVGQDTSYGGGIEYNGDGTPASTGSPSDSITLFRSDGGTLGWTAYNAYNDDHWIYKGDVRTRGQVRATGWWGSATSDQNGLAAELGVSAGRAHLISYNRSASSYGNLTISAPDIQFDYAGTVTVKSGGLGVNLTDWDTSNLKLDVNGHASIRRGYALYFGVNSTSLNSWEVKFGNSGSAAILNAQSFLFDNSGYGSETFLRVDQNGAALGNYGTYSGGAAARTLALHGNASSTYTGMLSLARSGSAQYYLYEESGYYKYQGQGAGVHQFLQSGSTVVAEISDDEIQHRSATGGKIRAVSITQPSFNASIGATWASGGGTGMFMEYYPGTALGYLQNSYPMSAGTVYGDIHIRQMSGGSWQTRLLFDNDQAKAVFQETVEVDSGTSSTFRVLCDNAGTATIEARGDGQGTGMVYVGQDSSYGGGIEYNGDGTPATTGAGSDYVALFRRAGGTNDWTARNYYSSNDWEFRAAVTAQGGMTAGGDIRSGGLVSANKNKVMRAAILSQSGYSLSGCYVIRLPGTTSNFSMPVIRITTYEYNSRAVNIYYIGGHNWQTASYWYNQSVHHIGTQPRTVRLGHDGTSHCIVLGEATDAWDYASIVVDVLNHPTYYQNNQDFTGSWTIYRTTTMPSAVSGNIVRRQLQSGAGNDDYAITSSGQLSFGGNGRFEYNNADSIRHQNQYGHIIFGPLNSGGAHIYTDRDRFYFNKIPSLISNTITSYNGDFTLYRAESSTYSVTITTGGLVSSQNVTAYSDRRLKTDIEPITGALDTVMKLQGVKYTRIDSGNRDIGFIAQEIEEKCPEIADRIVNTADDEMGTKNLNYQNMVALLTEAIKTQQQQIEALTARIEELENGDD